jgi:hypothetical protein
MADKGKGNTPSNKKPSDIDPGFSRNPKDIDPGFSRGPSKPSGPIPIPKIGGGKTLPMPKVGGGNATPVPMPKVNPRDRGRTLPMPATPGFQDRAAGVPDRANSPLRKIATGVGNYIGNIAREARDLPTALGTSAWSSFDKENSRPGRNQTQIDNSTKAGWNMKAQVKDVFQAIGGDTGGTRSDQYDNRTGRYAKGTSPSLNGPKPQKPRNTP